ncbi:MAG: chromate transporter [Acholeplasmataceae bacterium]|jgi:chromate transporter|nr:chromate transporter [Acholeplasmataceae bacterium]MDD4204279.1 chromate transporter [Acholeplasmataceae bacterium]MDD4824469.1 chromate transporter [Acholeplasmataceae bacterium]
MKLLFEIFLSFFKIGALTFGGGYAMIGVMHKDIVDKKGWMTNEEMLDLLAISESTPGPFAINSATFIGYKRAGFWGSFFATLGVVLPSFITIVLISLFLQAFSENQILHNALKGISAGVGVLILIALFRIGSKVPKTWLNFVIFIIATLIAFFDLFSLVYLLLAGALFGIVYGLIQARRGDKDVS